MSTQKRRTTIEWWPDGDGYKATEPGGDTELYGRGETPPEAVEHYCELIADSRDGEQ